MFRAQDMPKEAREAVEFAMQFLGWRAGLDAPIQGTSHSYADSWGRGYLLGVLDQVLQAYAIPHRSRFGLKVCYLSVRAVTDLPSKAAKDYFWSSVELYGTEEFDAGNIEAVAAVRNALQGGEFGHSVPRRRAPSLIRLLTSLSLVACALTGLLHIFYFS